MGTTSPPDQALADHLPFSAYDMLCHSRVFRVSSLTRPRLYSRDIGVLDNPTTFKAKAIRSAKMPKSTKAAPTHQSTLQGMWGKKDKEATEPAKVIPDERKINMDVDGSSAEKGEWLQI